MQRFFSPRCQAGMRNKILILFGLLTTGVLSCEKDVSPFSEQLHIGLNSCEQFTKDNQTLRLCFDTIVQESRCPINANCVWEGVAVARFTLHLNDRPHTLELATNNVLPGTTTDTTIQGYTIALKNLLPYPGGPTDETPSAQVLIERR
jgi:hypothetical protein